MCAKLSMPDSAPRGPMTGVICVSYTLPHAGEEWQAFYFGFMEAGRERGTETRGTACFTVPRVISVWRFMMIGFAQLPSSLCERELSPEHTLGTEGSTVLCTAFGNKYARKIAMTLPLSRSSYNSAIYQHRIAEIEKAIEGHAESF